MAVPKNKSCRSGNVFENILFQVNIGYFKALNSNSLKKRVSGYNVGPYIFGGGGLLVLKVYGFITIYA